MVYTFSNYTNRDIEDSQTVFVFDRNIFGWYCYKCLRRVDNAYLYQKCPNCGRLVVGIDNSDAKELELNGDSEAQRSEGKTVFDISNVNRLLNLNKSLEVWRVPDGSIAVSYYDCEIKDGGFLKTEFGLGETFEIACDDYMRKISGKTLVFNSCSDSRSEVTVL